MQAGDLKTAEQEFRQAVDLAPRDATFLGTLGAVLGMEGKLEESDGFLGKALRINPDDLASRRNLASNQFQLGLLPPAKANLEKILRARPGDTTSVLLLGMVKEELKDYGAAVHLLASVPGEVSRQPKALAALARAYYNTGQKEKARQTLGKLSNRPADPDGIFLGGQVAAQAGDFGTAKQMFDSIPASYRHAAQAGYQLALVRYRAGRIDESLSTLLKLMDDGHDISEVENLLGWCYFRRGEIKRAIAALDKAVSLDPANEFNYLDVGMILLKVERPTGALAAAEKSIEVAPRSYRGYRLKGLAETRLGKMTDAVGAFRQALNLNPDDEQSILGLATAQWDDGKVRDAQATFKKGFERLPRAPTLYLGFGTMLLKLAGTADPTAESRGVSALETALALDPALGEAHRQLGNRALTKGRNEEALRHLESAAELEPESSEVHYALGRTYQRLNRTEDAQKEFQLYQKLKSQISSPSASADIHQSELPAKMLVPSRLSENPTRGQAEAEH